MIVDPAVLSGDLFHLCGPLLADGTIIQPGNWGRVLRRWSWLHSCALREHALEEWRKVNEPKLPSRLECVYAFLSKDDAIAFRGKVIPGRQINGFEAHAIYRVRLIDPEKPYHLTHYNLVGPHGPAGHWPQIYWRPFDELATGAVTEDDLRLRAGAGGSGIELLTLSPLQVMERIEDE